MRSIRARYWRWRSRPSRSDVNCFNIPMVREMQREVLDNDPLTPLEEMEIAQSLEDVANGNYVVQPKDMSVKDFLSSL